MVHVWIHVPHLDLVEMRLQQLEMNLRCDTRRKNLNPLTLRAKNRTPKNRNSPFTGKPWIAELCKRWLLAAKKVPYKFPNDIPLELSTLHVVNGRFIFPPKYSNAHSLDTGPRKKKNCSVNLHINTHLCQSMAQNSEIWGGQKKKMNFLDISKIGSFRTSKRPIGDLPENPNQGV